jgi:tRNA threonylcarbamoyladenosine biosynthesis protein TsaE
MKIVSEDEMGSFGKDLATGLRVGDWIAINGPLGAGKTVLCAGILRGLGYQGDVASPSYAIVHQYTPPEVSIAVAHADLYRLNDMSELEELGLSAQRSEQITLVEWAERAGDFYTKPSHQISITPQDGSRIVTIKTNLHD